jgi:hypothetical protein
MGIAGPKRQAVPPFPIPINSIMLPEAPAAPPSDSGGETPCTAADSAESSAVDRQLAAEQRHFAIAVNRMEDTEEESLAVWKILRTLEERLVKASNLEIKEDGTVHCHICDQSFGNIGDLLEHCWGKH